jgi:hypothetical protein
MTNLRMASSAGAFLADRRYAPPPAADARPSTAHQKYLKDWSLVKRARFNAAKRCERMQDASTLAFAFAGVIGFLVPFYALLFKDVLSQHTKNVLDFSAYVTGMLSLALGLIEQAKDYPARARRFHICGRRVNRILRDLSITKISHDGELRPYIDAYEHALEECGDNHDDIDFTIAIIQTEIAHASGPERRLATARLRRVKLYERLVIYWLYMAVWIVPLLIGLLIWMFQATG